MATVDGTATTPDANGVVIGNGGAADRMAGANGNDTLQGQAAQNYYYGGQGNDTFIIGQRFLDSAFQIDVNAPVDYSRASVIVSDLGGAGGWNATNNDFVALSGFAAGSTLTVITATSNPTGNAPSAVFYYYDLFDAGANGGAGAHYLVGINSVNGRALTTQDYAFY